MSLIQPFRAWRPQPKMAAAVAALPYDVLSREEALQIGIQNPYSFLHVTRSEIDLTSVTDPYAPAVYEKADSNFKALRNQGILIQEEVPSFYLYRLQMGSHVQVGVAGCFSLAEYRMNQIKKHEQTRRVKEEDRIRHIRTLGAQTGPIYLTYSAVAEIDQLVQKELNSIPLYDFTAEDQVQHTVWKVSRTDEVIQRFASSIQSLYIADGHHRAAAAHQVGLDSTLPAQFLGVAFPSNQLQILPYHRVVRDLGSLSSDDFFRKVTERFLWVELGKELKEPLPQRGSVYCYFKDRWVCLSLHAMPGGRCVYEFDVEMLQTELLEPILGIGDPRTDPRIDFVGGIRGTAELEHWVQSGRAQVAFAMHPVSVDSMMLLADQGQTMPPKSTWFEPKLRDGLLIHAWR